MKRLFRTTVCLDIHHPCAQSTLRCLWDDFPAR
jgi:hypothetical protein